MKFTFTNYDFASNKLVYLESGPSNVEAPKNQLEVNIDTKIAFGDLVKEIQNLDSLSDSLSRGLKNNNNEFYRDFFDRAQQLKPEEREKYGITDEVLANIKALVNGTLTDQVRRQTVLNDLQYLQNKLSSQREEAVFKYDNFAAYSRAEQGGTLDVGSTLAQSIKNRAEARLTISRLKEKYDKSQVLLTALHDAQKTLLKQQQEYKNQKIKLDKQFTKAKNVLDNVLKAEQLKKDISVLEGKLNTATVAPDNQSQPTQTNDNNQSQPTQANDNNRDGIRAEINNKQNELRDLGNLPTLDEAKKEFNKSDAQLKALDSNKESNRRTFSAYSTKLLDANKKLKEAYEDAEGKSGAEAEEAQKNIDRANEVYNLALDEFKKNVVNDQNVSGMLKEINNNIDFTNLQTSRERGEYLEAQIKLEKANKHIKNYASNDSIKNADADFTQELKDKWERAYGRPLPNVDRLLMSEKEPLSPTILDMETQKMLNRLNKREQFSTLSQEMARGGAGKFLQSAAILIAFYASYKLITNKSKSGFAKVAGIAGGLGLATLSAKEALNLYNRGETETFRTFRDWNSGDLKRTSETFDELEAGLSEEGLAELNRIRIRKSPNSKGGSLQEMIEGKEKTKNFEFSNEEIYLMAGVDADKLVAYKNSLSPGQFYSQLLRIYEVSYSDRAYETIGDVYNRKDWTTRIQTGLLSGPSNSTEEAKHVPSAARMAQMQRDFRKIGKPTI